MRKSLMVGAVTLLVMAILSGIVLAKQDKTKGALAITTDPSNVLVSVNEGSRLIVEKYSPFWTGGLAPGSYIVTATFTNPEKVVNKTIEVIAGRTAPAHLSAKTHEELPFEMRLEVDKAKTEPGESAIITVTLLNTSSGKPLNNSCVVNLSTTLGNIVSSVKVLGTAQIAFMSQEAGTATVTAKARVGAKDLKESVVVTVVNPWTVMYEANELPTAADPPWVLSEQGDSSKASVSNGILTVEHYPAVHRYKRVGDPTSNDIGNILEARVKRGVHSHLPEDDYQEMRIRLRDKESSPGAGDAALLDVWIGMSGEDNVVRVVSEGVFEENYYVNTTDDFHIYRLELKGGEFRVYRDGALLSSSPSFQDQNEVGEITFKNAACSGQWDYVHFYTGGF